MTMLTSKQITKKIAGVKRSVASNRENIQEILLHQTAHAYFHKDVSGFTRLFAATNGMARKQIVQWVQDYGFATFKKDGSFKLNRKAHDGADFASSDELLADLQENARQWFDQIEGAESIVKALDAAARIRSVARAIQKAPEKHQEVKVNGAEIEAALVELREAMMSLPIPALAN